MTQNQLFLGLALLSRDASDFFKTNKDRNHFFLKKEFHNAKKQFLRALIDHTPVLLCKRIIQFNPNIKPENPLCLLKFTFKIGDKAVSFHTPQHSFNFPYTLTDKRVKILYGKIPADGQPKIQDREVIIELIKRFNSLTAMLYRNGTDKDLAMQRFETYFAVHAPIEILEQVNAMQS